jgi:CubicO group peptidase (beta-lactamase class C family)
MSATYWPTQDWQTADPAAVGMDMAQLSKLEQEIRMRFSSINGFIILRDGYLVLERYYNDFDETDAHQVFSVTKSLTSALIGIAIDRGYIEGVDQKVLDFFPEYTTNDSLKQQLTLRSLLTMTSGFMWRTGARGFEPMMTRLWRAHNWVAFILDLPIRERLMGRFQYNSANSHLLSAIITRATGKPACEFANEHLFPAIGIDPLQMVAQGGDESLKGKASHWLTDPQGHSVGGWGLAITPREMARFGLLYLRKGCWNGRQVLTEQWIEQTVTPHTPGYGYQWWLRDLEGSFTYSAVGRGGHHIFCVPEKDVVVAIASEPGGRWRDRWPLMEDFVIPAAQ